MHQGLRTKYGYYIAHSAKGSTWNIHKYIRKVETDGGKYRYIYAGDSSEESLLDKAKDKITDKAEDLKKEVDKKTKKVQKTIKKSVKDAKKKATKVTNKVKKTVNSRKQPTTMGAAAKRATKDTANYVKSVAKQSANRLKSATSGNQGVVSKAKNKITQTVDTVKTNRARDKAKESINNAKNIATTNYNKSVSYSGNTPKPATTTKTTSEPKKKKQTAQEMAVQAANESNARNRAEGIRRRMNSAANRRNSGKPSFAEQVDAIQKSVANSKSSGSNKKSTTSKNISSSSNVQRSSVGYNSSGVTRSPSNNIQKTSVGYNNKTYGPDPKAGPNTYQAQDVKKKRKKH